MKRGDLLKAAAAGAVSVTAAPLEEWRRSKPDFAVYVLKKLQGFRRREPAFPGGASTGRYVKTFSLVR
jgi:hypothetical protein